MGSYSSYYHPSFLPWSYPYIPQHHTVQSCQPSYPQSQSPAPVSTWQCPDCPTQEQERSVEHLVRDANHTQATSPLSRLSSSPTPNSTRLKRIQQLQERIAAHHTKVDRLIALLEERLHRLETTNTRPEAEAHQQGLQALTQILAEFHDHQSDALSYPTLSNLAPLNLAQYESWLPNLQLQVSLPLDPFEMSAQTVDPKDLRSEPPPSPPQPDLTSSQISTDLSQPESLYGDHEEKSSVYNVSQALFTLEPFSQSPESTVDQVPAHLSNQASHSGSAELGCGTETETHGADVAESSTAPTDRKRKAPASGVESVRQLRDRAKTAASSSVSSSNTSAVPVRPSTLPKRAKSTIGRKYSRGTGSMNETSTSSKKKKRATVPVINLPIGTLGKSSGQARVSGVKWPKKGPNTVRGISKEVQCEKCQGRIHWPCAGLREDEKLGSGEWICPDCLHLGEAGLPPLLPVLSDDCVRSDCIRRKHQKMQAKPGDAEQFFTERPIGRRTVVPATLTSGAKYEYLIKWWGYPLDQSTWEPTESFGNPSEIASHFIDLAMDEGVSPELMRGGFVLLKQAKEVFDDQGVLKKV